MNTFVSFCKKLHFGRFVGTLVLGFFLLLNVACSNGNDVGARPNNPPVQMGGQNNPHKAGGDGYSEYQMSTDPAVGKRDRASILELGQLIAVADGTAEQSFSGQKDQAKGLATRKPKASLKEMQQMSEPRQEVIDRSNPNEKLLEKAGRTFKEASKHLTGSTDESIRQSGVTQQH